MPFQYDLFIQQQSYLHSLIAKCILTFIQLLFGANSIFYIIKSKEEIRSILRISILAHILIENISILFADWLHGLHFDSTRCNRRVSNKQDGQRWTLPIVLIVVADDIGPSGRV